MREERYIAGLAQYVIDRGLTETCDRHGPSTESLTRWSLKACADAEPVELPLEEILKAMLYDAVA